METVEVVDSIASRDFPSHHSVVVPLIHRLISSRFHDHDHSLFLLYHWKCSRRGRLTTPPMAYLYDSTSGVATLLPSLLADGELCLLMGRSFYGFEGFGENLFAAMARMRVNAQFPYEEERMGHPGGFAGRSLPRQSHETHGVSGADRRYVYNHAAITLLQTSSSWFDIIVAMLGGEMYSFPGPIDRPTRIRLPILPSQYLLGDTVVTSETRSWRIQKFSCCKRQESRCLFFQTKADRIRIINAVMLVPDRART